MLNNKIGENYNANDVLNPNDLRKRILNIDSRFRADMTQLTTDFTFKLDHTYKNLIRLRISSIELPKCIYAFNIRNNSFVVKAYDINNVACIAHIIIQVGNYTQTTLIAAIQVQLDIQLRDQFGIFLSISLDPVSNKVTITHNGVSTVPPPANPTANAKPFILDFALSNQDNTRRYEYGLGYNLGYRLPAYRVANLKVSGLDTYSQTGECCLDVGGDQYMFLSVNDLYTVEQKTDENYIQCLAKIVLQDNIAPNYCILMSNEIVFPSPTDLKILQIKLLDPYGEVVDLNCMNFSFSLEITEVLNTALYDFYRNYIWFGSVPSVNYKTVQGSAQQLIKGVGPPL
jgi:hypothetical protein